jgi:hypothetical protein
MPKMEDWVTAGGVIIWSANEKRGTPHSVNWAIQIGFL